MRLTIELLDGVKHITLHSVSGPQPISWRPEENKRGMRKNLLSLLFFELKHQTFPVLVLLGL